MKALIEKYIALTVPSMKPSRQISRLPQSGHHRRRTGAAEADFIGFGANASTSIAIKTTGTLQKAKAHCQVPTKGSTSGSIRATGKISPTISPLVYTAVAKPILCGAQARTAEGIVTC